MPATWEQVEDAAAAIRTRCGPLPDTAVVLGSGLGEFAFRLTDLIAIPDTECPHWPVSRGVGHAGQLVVGTIAGARVAALSGRVHQYEGYDLATVTFATRVLARSGVRRLVLTNAAGGINAG